MQTRLVCLENTHNRGGGRILPYDGVEQICSWAHENELKTHLDGARLFNAVVASGISAKKWCQHFDTVSICFSKGLGAPVGSVLVGSQEIVSTLRRHRKLFGGGMRQSGIISAGALYALDNNIERLSEDHDSASHIAKAIGEIEGVTLAPVDTNIVIFHIADRLGTAADFCERAKAKGVWMFPFGAQQVRAVTHLHISQQDADSAANIIAEVAQNPVVA